MRSAGLSLGHVTEGGRPGTTGESMIVTIIVVAVVGTVLQAKSCGGYHIKAMNEC